MPKKRRKRYQWKCPRCGSVVLGPARLSYNDERRFCQHLNTKPGGGFPRREHVHRFRPAAAREEREAKRRERKRRNREAAKRTAKEAELEREREEQTEILVDEDAHALEAAGFCWIRVPDAQKVRGHVLLRCQPREPNRGPLYWIPTWIDALLNLNGIDIYRSGPNATRVLFFVRYWCRDNDREAQLRAISTAFGDEEALRFAIENYPFPLPRVIRDAFYDPF